MAVQREEINTCVATDRRVESGGDQRHALTSPIVPDRRQLHVVGAGAVGTVGQTGLHHGGCKTFHNIP